MSLQEVRQGRGAGDAKLHPQVLAPSSALPVPLSFVKFCGHGNVHKVCVFVPAQGVCAACTLKPTKEPDGDRSSTLCHLLCTVEKAFQIF